MIVDVHIHFLSPHAIEAARTAPDRYGVRVIPDGPRPRLVIGSEPATRPLLEPLYTLDRHLAFLTGQGIDAAVFGPLMDVAGYSLAPGPAAAWSRLQNEALAASLAEAAPPPPAAGHPRLDPDSPTALQTIAGRHRGLAAVPLQEPKLAAEELRFAVERLGLRGAMVDPNALGRPLGDRALDPFWQAAADLGAPVILHPFLLEAVERFGRHYLHNLVGYPFETTLAAASLILGGTLDRFPGLDVVLVHGGGFLPYHIGRFDRGHAGREEVRADGAGRPSGYLRRFHYDTLVQFPRALAYLVDVVGADRVLLGSDHPFWMGDPEPLTIVREAGLSAEARRAILGDNAARLFKLGAEGRHGSAGAPRAAIGGLGGRPEPPMSV
jgi:aminocarboxymuconate-semialdehyde decarboxylase